MLLRFDQFLNESSGFSNSLVAPSNFIYNFISSKIDWWVGRRGPANYSENFVFFEDDFDFEKNPDFPIRRFKLSLNIKVVSSSPISLGRPILVSGAALFYKGELKNEESSDIENGEAIPNMEVTLYMIKDRYMMDLPKMRKNLKALIRHEMTHLYQYFKVKIRTKRNKSAWRNTPISWDLKFISQFDDSKTFADLLDVAYFLMTREEFDASLAEVTAGSSERVDRKKDLMSKFIKMDPDWMVGQIRNEMDSFYGDLDIDDMLEEVPKIFLEEYEKDCNIHKVKPLKWALKLRNKTFDQFILAMLDIVKYRGEKWLKKASKIEYRNR